MSKVRGFYPLKHGDCASTELLADPVLTLLHSGRCPAHIDFLSGGDAQLGEPHPFDVDSCVRVPVQRGVAAFALPAALLECKGCIDSSTHMASLAGGRPPVDFHDGGAGVAGHTFQDGHELCKSKVGNFPPPQALHPIEIKVFDADDGILAHKLICQLEEPVAPAVADTLVDALQIANRTPAVPTSFLAAGCHTMSCSQLFE